VLDQVADVERARGDERDDKRKRDLQLAPSSRPRDAADDSRARSLFSAERRSGHCYEVHKAYSRGHIAKPPPRSVRTPRQEMRSTDDRPERHRAPDDDAHPTLPQFGDVEEEKGREAVVATEPARARLVSTEVPARPSRK
jgi:hypothetical protein